MGQKTMTPKQYRNAINRLGLSQVAAAHLLGVNPRTSRHWANDTSPPDSVRQVLQLRLAIIAAIEELERDFPQGEAPALKRLQAAIRDR